MLLELPLHMGRESCHSRPITIMYFDEKELILWLTVQFVIRKLREFRRCIGLESLCVKHVLLTYICAQGVVVVLRMNTCLVDFVRSVPRNRTIEYSVLITPSRFGTVCNYLFSTDIAELLWIGSIDKL